MRSSRDRNKSGAVSRDFHGDPDRFPVVAELVSDRWGREIRYIADVAGGQGQLSRLLYRRFNYEAEVVDPRGWRLRGVRGREEKFAPNQASYYDLVIGLHPDQATRAVALSAIYTRTLLVPCCNYWDNSQRLGTFALVEAIEEFYRRTHVNFERISLPLNTPKKLALLTSPPDRPVDFDLALATLPKLDSSTARPSDLNRQNWLQQKKNKPG